MTDDRVELLKRLVGQQDIGHLSVQEQRALRLKLAYEEVLQTPAGRLVLWDVMGGEEGLLANSMKGNAYTASNEGARAVRVGIRTRIVEVGRHYLHLMENEADSDPLTLRPEDVQPKPRPEPPL